MWKRQKRNNRLIPRTFLQSSFVYLSLSQDMHVFLLNIFSISCFYCPLTCPDKISQWSHLWRPILHRSDTFIGKKFLSQPPVFPMRKSLFSLPLIEMVISLRIPWAYEMIVCASIASNTRNSSFILRRISWGERHASEASTGRSTSAHGMRNEMTFSASSRFMRTAIKRSGFQGWL
jgi:hypothetical protein